MVYDRKPITDHFRKIDRDRVLGVMQVEGNDRHYFFALGRVGEGAVQAAQTTAGSL
ncbi:DUF4334 domain-containing protein [Sinorhizobium sojae]|uniref:DUF4334 domain-containing protein n=1 Tax=Sinorhizobium sojae TaxID=716925 RepID=UPI001FCAF9AD|nr:DUF4334 domain-containing protein [Sinorhizobium sojae]